MPPLPPEVVRQQLGSSNNDLGALVVVVMPLLQGVATTPASFAGEAGIKARNFCEEPGDGGIDCSSIPFNGNVRLVIFTSGLWKSVMLNLHVLQCDTGSQSCSSNDPADPGKYVCECDNKQVCIVRTLTQKKNRLTN